MRIMDWANTICDMSKKGGRKPVVPDSDILLPFVESGDPVVSPAEIAENLPIGETGVYKRLRKLEERELVESKKLGQARAWWITEKGEAYLAGELDESE